MLPTGTNAERIAKTVVIAQPTFLPWIGWFDLADQADVLIVLDDVSFSKQSWQQRNQIRTPQGLQYVTVPVRTSGRLGQVIKETELANTVWVEKLVKTIAANYARAPHFERYFHSFSNVLRDSASSGMLAGMNRQLIAWLVEQLDIKTPQLLASELGVDDNRGAHVAKLCERVNGTNYLSPAGAENYLIEDRAEFDRRSITVELHVYAHPEYNQCFRPFIPYATVLDLLMNEGANACAVMRSGRRPPRPLGYAAGPSLDSDN